MKTKHYITKKNIVISSMVCISIIIFCNVLILLINHTRSNTNLEYTENPNNETKILVISPHQDDETIIAGGYMIKTVRGKGQVFVMYTTDGALRTKNSTKDEIMNTIKKRESEARDALSLIGIPKQNIIFLRNKDQKGLMDTHTLNMTIDTIGQKMIEIRPNIVFIPAYEGGHCDHDLTNFATMTAISRYNMTDIIVYEAPEYTRYRSVTEYLIITAEIVSFTKLEKTPQFINHKNVKRFKLNMSADEIELKHTMFDSFKSQSLDLLKAYHNGEDIYRIVPQHNYSQPPYEHTTTIEYDYCLIKNVFREDINCKTYNICQIEFSTMRQVMEYI